MKKSFFSIITAFFIFTSNANSAGIPVFDGAGMAQNMVDNAMQYANMIKDYAQQVQMYKQMIVDTLNFEKHLKALGVDMNEWADIIGEISDTISGIEGLASSIQNIPDSFKLQFIRAQKACSFLNSKVSGFSSAASELKGFKRQTNRCFMALNSKDVINTKLNELNRNLQKATDINEIKRIQNEISNIRNAAQFVKQEKAQETANELVSFHEAFFGEDEAHAELKIQSYKDQAKEFQKISKQMQKAKNEKQVQAITNTILLKMLEQNTQMQGIMLSYSRAIASQSYNNINQNHLSEDSFEQKEVNYKFPSNPYGNIKKMETNKYGMPIFRLN
ncbi:type IV secretion system protein [Campylobacter sp.]|uniref:type IV secretion system protein n=1 Tax=Campylobacter sp. TaxID=205 RepID=UPI002A800744|nr:type IV secretion system protein [Campylobacter sp.]MDY4155007.1 type IV secretion system protein [Campylobacter sp.]